MGVFFCVTSFSCSAAFCSAFNNGSLEMEKDFFFFCALGLVYFRLG